MREGRLCLELKTTATTQEYTQPWNQMLLFSTVQPLSFTVSMIQYTQMVACLGSTSTRHNSTCTRLYSLYCLCSYAAKVQTQTGYSYHKIYMLRHAVSHSACTVCAERGSVASIEQLSQEEKMPYCQRQKDAHVLLMLCFCHNIKSSLTFLKPLYQSRLLFVKFSSCTQ